MITVGDFVKLKKSILELPKSVMRAVGIGENSEVIVSADIEGSFIKIYPCKENDNKEKK